ncbi:uncharacterized protein LOC126782330 [Argentina anserina]|uniref:uncharacterized protein LOC126782330 n=1 Tax=Argentina anserina TaxID=57926 RepID=UPI0021762C9C|nr:uncharacterized protein LOC126782330 [Potentilla anserina]
MRCGGSGTESSFEFSYEWNYVTNCGEWTQGYGNSFGDTGIKRLYADEESQETDHVLWSFIKGNHSSAVASPVPFTEYGKASFHFHSQDGKLKACGVRLLCDVPLQELEGPHEENEEAGYEEEEDPLDFEEALDFMMESDNETRDGITSDDDPKSPTHEH